MARVQVQPTASETTSASERLSFGLRLGVRLLLSSGKEMRGLDGGVGMVGIGVGVGELDQDEDGDEAEAVRVRVECDMGLTGSPFLDKRTKRGC